MEQNSQHIDLDLLTRFLAGETSSEETQLVQDWEKVSDINRQQLDELRQTWTLMDNTSAHSDIDLDKEWSYHLQMIQPAKKAKTISLTLITSIAAALIIGIGAIYYGINFSSTKTYKTQYAQTRQLVLPDGSKVTLNAESKLYYKNDFNKTLRTVVLKGEGFFEVVKNPEKPFIISVGDAEIKVLGTSFNVKAYRDMEKIEVTVKEGTVSVADKKNNTHKIIVTAGDRANYNKNSSTVEKQPNPDRNYISWKTRQIIFENDSLSTIINTLQDVYHTNIKLENPRLGNCTVTTSFDNKELITVLRILESTLDIKFNKEGNTIVVTGKGCF